MDQPSDEHQHSAAAHARQRPIVCAVLTTSDSRDESSDASGDRIEELLHEAGHQVVARRIVPDDAATIRSLLEEWIGSTEIDAIVTTGGTGIGPRDVTAEVVRSLLTVELEGFGELFRVLSYEQVQAAAMISRAVGGMAGGDTFLFALPGSRPAVELAMTRLILQQLPHLVWLRRGPGP
jgi:molybdenum cofactor biosynthesis protein B